MSKKRFLAGLLSAAMALSVAVFNPTVVKASGFEDAKKVKLDKTYEGAFSKNDLNSEIFGKEYYYNIYFMSDEDKKWYNFEDYRCSTDDWKCYTKTYKIELPADGSIDLSMNYPVNVGLREFMPNAHYRYYVFSVDNVDNPVDVEIKKIEFKSDYKGEVYNGTVRSDNMYSNYIPKHQVLKKGSYYVLVTCQIPADQKMYFKKFNIGFNYSASVGGVDDFQVTAKKGGVVLKWKETEGADGYAMEMTEGYYNHLETYHEYTLIKIKKGKTTKKVMKKLERNAYYDFAIRAYKDVKVNGKKKRYYSDWSRVSTKTY